MCVRKAHVACVAMGVVMASYALPASGGLRFEDGRWRLALSGLDVVKSGSHAYNGDPCFTASIEYEFPAYPHGKLGLRLPLLYLPAAEGLFGGGFGIATRAYQNKERYDGIFGEVGASVLWLSSDYKDNDSRVNFMLEAGLGYKFPSTDWDVSLRYGHLSNANLGHRNAGVNGIGITLGYTF